MRFSDLGGVDALTQHIQLQRYDDHDHDHDDQRQFPDAFWHLPADLAQELFGVPPEDYERRLELIATPPVSARPHLSSASASASATEAPRRFQDRGVSFTDGSGVTSGMPALPSAVPTLGSHMLATIGRDQQCINKGCHGPIDSYIDHGSKVDPQEFCKVYGNPGCTNLQ